MPSLLQVPLFNATLKEALAALAKFYPADEYPEKAKLIIKKAGFPVLIWDEAKKTMRGLTSSGVVIYTPLTGTTVTGRDVFADQLLEIEPAGTIAALTVNLELADNVPIDAVKKVAFSQIVTALTITPSAAGGGTVNGAAITAAAVNTSIAYQKTASKTWRRLY